MFSSTQKRIPTPGKKVQRNATDDGGSDAPDKKRFSPAKEKFTPTISMMTITQVKKLKFSLLDYKHKFIGRVVCLNPPKEHKSEDVQYHRRAIVIADQHDYIRGFVRSNDDNFLQSGKCYMFSKYKIYRLGEIMIHDDTTKNT